MSWHNNFLVYSYEVEGKWADMSPNWKWLNIVCGDICCMKIKYLNKNNKKSFQQPCNLNIMYILMILRGVRKKSIISIFQYKYLAIKLFIFAEI